MFEQLTSKEVGSTAENQPINSQYELGMPGCIPYLSGFVLQIGVVEGLASAAVVVEDEVLVQVLLGVLAFKVTHQVGLADASNRTLRAKDGPLTQERVLNKMRQV